MNETNTHPNERDPEAIHVWDGTVKDDLKELINIIYTNKMHILFCLEPGCCNIPIILRIIDCPYNIFCPYLFFKKIYQMIIYLKITPNQTYLIDDQPKTICILLV